MTETPKRTMRMYCPGGIPGVEPEVVEVALDAPGSGERIEALRGEGYAALPPAANPARYEASLLATYANPAWPMMPAELAAKVTARRRQAAQAAARAAKQQAFNAFMGAVLARQRHEGEQA